VQKKCRKIRLFSRENLSKSNLYIYNTNTKIQSLIAREEKKPEKTSQNPEPVDSSKSIEEIREAIALSERLTTGLQKAFPDKLDRLDSDGLVLVVGAVISSLLPTLYSPATVWAKAVSRHGSSAILGLVAALEDTSIRHPERWFALYASGSGGFANFESVAPTLAKIAAQRAKQHEKAEQEELEKANTINRKHMKDVLGRLEEQGRFADLHVLRSEFLESSTINTDKDGLCTLHVHNRFRSYSRAVALIASETAALCGFAVDDYITQVAAAHTAGSDESADSEQRSEEPSAQRQSVAAMAEDRKITAEAVETGNPGLNGALARLAAAMNRAC
jgi:hypothetical protein